MRAGEVLVWPGALEGDPIAVAVTVTSGRHGAVKSQLTTGQALQTRVTSSSPPARLPREAVGRHPLLPTSAEASGDPGRVFKDPTIERHK